MQAETSREETVTVSIVQPHAWPSASRADGAGNKPRPYLDIAPGVADHGRPSGGARRRMEPHDLFASYCEQSKGIAGAQILLAGEGKPGEVGQAREIVRVRACRIERPAIVRHALIGPTQRALEPLQLQGRNLLTRGNFNGLEVFAARRQVEHRDTLVWSQADGNVQQ